MRGLSSEVVKNNLEMALCKDGAQKDLRGLEVLGTSGQKMSQIRGNRKVLFCLKLNRMPDPQQGFLKE